MIVMKSSIMSERASHEEFKTNLERRTLAFAIGTVNALSSLPNRQVLNVIVGQLAKSATSIGANYREANRAESKSDCIHKIGIVCKEASETVYWLEILLKAQVLTQEQKLPFESLTTEANELLALFKSISRSLRATSTTEKNNAIPQ